MIWPVVRMKIIFTSGGMRLFENHGWTWQDVKNIAAENTRIIYFNDVFPYWIIDRVNVQVLLAYKPSYDCVFSEDKNKTLEQLIVERNL